MNIINFWKDYIIGKTNSQYDRNEFLQALNTNVPDWKEQVKNKDLWPELHSQGNFINECDYTNVIIEEAGLEFACYLVENQWGKRHLDASSALSFCVNHISTDWEDFPIKVKEKILLHELSSFLKECQQNPSLWAGLDKGLKDIVLNEADSSERAYISDLLLYSLWSKKLNYEDTPYVRFVTDEFIHLKDGIKRDPNGGRHYAHMLQRWEMPSISEDLGHLRYQPSSKLNAIKIVTSHAEDYDSVSFIQALENSIRHIEE